MDKLNEELLRRIEAVLDIKFYDWQVNYLLNIPEALDMRITGRCTGKTTAYIIKKLFKSEEPLRLYERQYLENISDWWSVTNRIDRKEPHYTRWFEKELRRIYEMFISHKIQPRPVFFTRQQEIEYINTHTKEFIRNDLTAQKLYQILLEEERRLKGE